MSEFQTNPEESLRAELAEAETNLENINKQFAALQDGNYLEKRTKEEQKKLMALATFTKRNIYNLLIKLGDIDGIRSRLEAGVAPAVELEQEEGIPAYLEPIVEDTFAIDVSTQEAMDKVDPRVFKVFHELVNRHNLMTFEVDEEEDDEEETE